MKSRLLVLVLALTALGIPCFAGAVHVTGNLSADFLGGTTAQQIINTYTAGDQPLFWGIGWEVILDHIGFGGDYLVSFFRDSGELWWMDWCAPALFMSYHPFGGKALFDPFLQAGIGSSGRLLLDPRHTSMYPPPTQDLFISLFPFVGGGIALNLDGLLVSAKVIYTPYSSQIPVTDIPAYPLGKFQVNLSAGFSIGW